MPNFRVLASIATKISNFLPEGERKKGRGKVRRKRPSEGNKM